MIKQTEQLGASLLGRVEARNAATAFGAGERGSGNIDREGRNRMLHTLLGKGIQLVDKAIDVKLDREMIEGSTLALAGYAEEELDTNFLTKDWKIAGHRNMTASLRQQEWQAEMLKELTSGIHNDKTPTEYAQHLNASFQHIVPIVEGMSQQARLSMLEKTITANQTLLSKQATMRAQAIVDQRISSWQVSANSLLETANAVKGTSDEGLVAQQMQAFLREVMADPNTPLEKKIEFAVDLQKAAADIGAAYVAYSVYDTPLIEGGTVGGFIPTKEYGKGIAAINKAFDKDRWRYHGGIMKDFMDAKHAIKEGRFDGDEHSVIMLIQQMRTSGGITDGEGKELYAAWLNADHLKRNQERMIKYWSENNQTGLQRIKVTNEEGKKAYIQAMVNDGLTLEEQVIRATDLFTTSNGARSIVDWVGSDILSPIMDEIIYSDGEVLADNLAVWSLVTGQIDKLNGLNRELYIGELMRGMSDKQAGFLAEYIERRKDGSSPEASITSARSTFQKDLAMEEVGRSAAVRRNEKLIDETVNSVLDVQGLGGNFLWNNFIRAKFGSEAGQVDSKRGTGSWFLNPEHTQLVDERNYILAEEVRLGLKQYVRANPSNVSKDKLKSETYRIANQKIKGDGDEVVIFRGNANFDAMFPNAPEAVKGQQDELIAYTLKNLPIEDEAIKQAKKVYTFTGNVLSITALNPNGSPINIDIPREQLQPMIEEYQREQLINRGGNLGSWEEYSQRLDRAMSRRSYQDQGVNASFAMIGYDNKYANYSRQLIEQLYSDNLKLEGWELDKYPDDPKGGKRVSIGMGVNSGNKDDPRFKPYFDIVAREGKLNTAQAESLTELAVKVHLENSGYMIKKHMGSEFVEASDDLTLAAFKLSYGQWRGGDRQQSTRDIFEGVRDGDVDRMLRGLHASNFFAITAGGSTSNDQYKYVLRKLIGAMEDLHGRQFN